MFSDYKGTREEGGFDNISYLNLLRYNNMDDSYVEKFRREHYKNVMLVKKSCYPKMSIIQLLKLVLLLQILLVRPVMAITSIKSKSKSSACNSLHFLYKLN